MGMAFLPRNSNLVCLRDGGCREKGRGGGILFYWPQPASICPDSAVFLIMSKPEKKKKKRLICYPNLDPEKLLSGLRIRPAADAKCNPAQEHPHPGCALVFRLQSKHNDLLPCGERFCK